MLCLYESFRLILVAYLVRKLAWGDGGRRAGVGSNIGKTLKYTTTDIIKFLVDLSGTDKIESGSDIFHDIGMRGDDFHEMIEKFSKQFSVNMKDYLWYFHCDEEGQSFGGTFFKPPYLRVKRIPVTPSMLTEFANNRKWNIIYPEHKLPKRRYDILINQILLGLFLAGTIIWAIVKWII